MKKTVTKFSTLAATVMLCAVISGVGCTPSIGDACEANVDCDTGQTCDLSQDGGYCTITPCPRTGCPSGSLCVRFSPVSTYCMQACGVFDYCREDYKCVTGFKDCDGNELEPFCNQALAKETADTTVMNDINIPDVAVTEDGQTGE